MRMVADKPDLAKRNGQMLPGSVEDARIRLMCVGNTPEQQLESIRDLQTDRVRLVNVPSDGGERLVTDGLGLFCLD